MSENNSRETEKNDLKHYTRKLWITVGIISLLVIVIFILKAAFNVLLMVFAGSLMAIYFHGLANLLERKIKLSHGWCLLTGIFITLALVGVLFWFLGAKISMQVGEMTQDIPEILRDVRERLGRSDIGRKLLFYLSDGNGEKMMKSFQDVFRTSFGVVGDMYIILFIGIFFTVNPKLYREGIIKLIPPGNKKQARDVIRRLDFTLKGWLKGMLIAMFFIASLSFIGLSLIGVPMGLALAFLAGFLNFIPNFGPLIAMIPAVLIGFTVSANTALLIALLYVVIQAIESNVVTPMIQNVMIKIPPALIIISQVLFGTLTGGLGIILATPLLVVIIVLVDELYVKKQRPMTDQLD
ncbi:MULTISPECIES: AI-2E family transporter [Olivibacter]|jgi:predicted PurR-regulated permease PerM|uniref:AI-2E family transporter n=2 Tax=Sphingobacteriaceae TaxID=84566 RepID=F4C4A6_SPHS2|nr:MULTISPECIES: AI-2E family transporter [Olivibacter]MCL4638935.1 AI-2E family transporter [Olivibacter sp. UJ_SKK_5.1]MDX3914084.1 AI-2E family transporter [Pseudosphingobacterium sp.]QEL02229.1 AI-2E family transporter [Olivibacter sp. LS-1]